MMTFFRLKLFIFKVGSFLLLSWIVNTKQKLMVVRVHELSRLSQFPAELITGSFLQKISDRETEKNAKIDNFLSLATQNFARSAF